MKKKLCLNNNRGQGLIEYIIIVAMIAVGAISLIRVLHQSVNSQFAQIAKALGAASVNTVLSTGTSAAHEIVSFAEKEKMNLIVIGSRGMGATQRFLLGSVAGKVVRYSPCCVYVVKEPCSCSI